MGSGYFSDGPGMDVDEYHYSPTKDKVRVDNKIYYIVSGYSVGRTVKACATSDFNADGSFRSMRDTYWYLKYGLIFTSEMDIMSGGNGKYVIEVDADDYGLMYMERDGNRLESMTVDELYPWTKDRKRNRSKTYYYQSGESSCEQMKAYADASKSWFDSNGEFRSKDDPFWVEKGFDFSKESDQFVPYREKNEDLAGSESQGSCGGGQGGCGKKGGACCAKAKNCNKKNCCKNKLCCCKKKASEAFSCSADVDSLLSGLISVATCCTGLCDLLKSLIEPEKLGMMTQMIDSTRSLLSQSSVIAQNVVADVSNVMNGDIGEALSLSNAAVMAAIAMETGDVQAAIAAAMALANTNIGQSVTTAATNLGVTAASCAGGCCGGNTTLNQQMDLLANTSTDLKSIISTMNADSQSQLGDVSTLISSLMGSTPAATQALSAIASAQTSINNISQSSLTTMQNAYNVASILGTK